VCACVFVGCVCVCVCVCVCWVCGVCGACVCVGVCVCSVCVCAEVESDGVIHSSIACLVICFFEQSLIHCCNHIQINVDCKWSCELWGLCQRDCVIRNTTNGTALPAGLWLTACLCVCVCRGCGSDWLHS
jgi:hypothetical protein